METQKSNENAFEFVTKQVILNFENQNKAITKFFNKYPDEVYENEIAPGKNRAIYILGHLVATNDSILALLNLQSKMFPDMEMPFVKSADRALENHLTIKELKDRWEQVNNTLIHHFNKLEPHQWLERHTSVSEEDFIKEPHRNKLNIVLSRSSHIGYHAGQLALLKDKELVG